MVNILKKADEIINERSEEKERQYGPFSESMDAMRDIFNSITGKELTTKDMFIAIIALKLSRERYAHKEDNLLDLVAYVGAMNNYIESNQVLKPSMAAYFKTEQEAKNEYARLQKDLESGESEEPKPEFRHRLHKDLESEESRPDYSNGKGFNLSAK